MKARVKRTYSKLDQHKMVVVVEKYRRRVGRLFRDGRTARKIKSLVPSFFLPTDEPLRPENVLADCIIGSRRPAFLMRWLTKHPWTLRRILKARTPSEVMDAVKRLEKPKRKKRAK